MVDIQIIRERLSLILPGIDQADILLREEELSAVPGVLAPQHRNVQRTVQHLLVKVAAVPGGNIQPDTGILFVVFGQHLRQAVVGKIDRHTRFQGAAHLALHGVQPAAQLLHLLEGGTAVLQHLFSCRGKADALPGAEQNFHPQLLLHGFDPLGQRRLGHIEFIRRMGDVPCLIQHFQQLKVFLVH